MATRSPVTRPVLARTSSAAHGFFLFGIIELPLASESGSSANPYSAPVQATISALSRDRWIITRVTAESSSTTKSRSETASRELAVARAKPRSRARRSRSRGNPLPASAPGFHLFGERLKTAVDLLSLGSGQHAGAHQGASVGTAPLDVFAPEPDVDRQ